MKAANKCRLGVGLVFCSLIGICVSVCLGRRSEPTPPYKTVHASMAPKELYQQYVEDEAQADQLYKGKVLLLYDVSYGYTIRKDVEGEKYVAALSIADPTQPTELKEVIRCYLYRPQDPIVEYPGSERCNIKGICMGRQDGVIILRNSYLIMVGGPEW